MKDFTRIGLTGGIAAGKSAVTNRLRERGAAVVDADAAARAVVEPGTAGLQRIAARFGAGVLRTDGALDRPALAALVFEDAAARADLNAIVHPLVGEWMRAEEARLLADTRLVFWDVPLLYESGMAEWMDCVWLVSAPEELRAARIMARDGIPRAAALARIASQMPEAEKRRRADVILENTGSIEALHAQVDALYDAAREGGSIGTH